MPAVSPPSRQVLLMPEAIPPCHDGTTAVEAASRVGLRIPRASPQRTSPGRITVHDEVVCTLVIQRVPPAASPRPRPSGIFGLTVPVIRPASGAITRTAPLIAAIRRPAPSAE